MSWVPFICGIAKSASTRSGRALGKPLYGFIAAGCFNNAVAVGFQHELEDGEFLFVVVDEEYDLFGTHVRSIDRNVETVEKWQREAPVVGRGG